jgi:hypothetical protein
MGTLLQGMGVVSLLPQHTYSVLTGQTFFPTTIAAPFMAALRIAFIFGAILCFAAAICSALRGKNTVCPDNGTAKVEAAQPISE